MRTIRDYQFIAPEDRGASVAIGNFDGVHLGHRTVIDMARREGTPLGILTFEPHPREYFAPDSAPFRLMNSEARAQQLEKLGVERLYELNFNDALSSLSAEDFAREVIKDGLGLTHVVVGEDFQFGKDRSGDAAALVAFGKEFGFDVTVAPLVSNDEDALSSTAIRQALTDGKPEKATKMLGHRHRISGRVETGHQRGRELGFPTANLSMNGLHLPKFGVYAVLVDVLDGPHQGQYKGVASLGNRPTFGVNIPNLETFLFDFSGDLYGAELSVALVAFQRPELKFDGLEPLIEQMDLDVIETRQILADL